MHFPLVARGRRSTGNDIVRGGADRSFTILSFELALLLTITRLLVGRRSLGLQKMTQSKQMHAKETISTELIATL
jgi:formate hydrogenlyase subunit 4